SFAVVASLPLTQIRSSILLKVRFILGVWIFFVGGSRWSQCFCVASFITNKLPLSSTRLTVSLVVLCLNANFLSAPKLNDPMAAFSIKSFSPSLCQAIPSLPSWYKLSRQELYCSPLFSSSMALRESSSFVHGNAVL